MTTSMIICAWCKRIMQPGTLPASHGICPECQATEIKALEEFERK